jgi:uncharacterized membrane protein
MKKNIAFFSIVACIATTAIVVSCKSKKETAKTESEKKTSCGNAETSYAKDVKPILDANCASSCHSAKKKSDGIDLSSYETVKDIAGRKSFLGAIRHESGYTPMPKNRGKLDEASIQKISCWVENGMKQ